MHIIWAGARAKTFRWSAEQHARFWDEMRAWTAARGALFVDMPPSSYRNFP